MQKITENLCNQVGIDVNYLANTKQIVLIEELIKQVAEHCAQLCGSQADKKIIRSAFNIPLEPGGTTKPYDHTQWSIDNFGSPNGA